jgi:hypothetical protein
MKPPFYMYGGFGVMLNSTINILSFLKYQNIEFVPYFYWTNDLFYQKELGNNVFNYYFENTKNIKWCEDSYNNIMSMPNDWLIDCHVNMNSDIIINKDKIKKYHDIFNEYFKIKKEPFLEFKGKTLGVQYRFTDKIKEVLQITPARMVEIIKSKLDEYDTIFISTDYKDIIDTLSEESKIIYTDSIRSNNMEGIHFQNFNRPMDNYLKGLECLDDIILLSKCDDLLFSRSNVSLSALIMNGNKYNSIELINNM